MKKISTVIAIAVLFFTASCTTVKVTKVTPGNNPEGLRYALGKPFIKVTPNPAGDGTYSAELIYLPDDNQIYAVKASAFMTKYTLELNLDESGVLKKLDLSKSSESPAKDLVTAAGELTKTEIERTKQEAKEAEDELKETIKTNKAALAATLASIDQKELDIEVAKNALRSLRTLPESDENKEHIRLAELNIRKLELELESHRKKLTSLQQEAAGFNASSNAPKNGHPVAYGPVLFEIKETPETKGAKHKLELVAVTWDNTTTKQKQFDAPLKADIVAIERQGQSVAEDTKTASFDAGGAATVVYTFNLTVKSIDVKQSRLVNAADTKTIFFDQVKTTLTAAGENKIDLKIEIDKKNVPPDVYKLIINFSYLDKDGAEQNDGKVTLKLTLK